MDIRKIQTSDLNVTPQTKGVTPGKGPGFEQTLKQIQDLDKSKAQKAPAVGPAAMDGLKFSNHAIDRMRTRGISFSQDDIGRLNEAVSKAAAKGSKDSLVLFNDSALIVSVKNNTVVTVMDKAALKENVFTNIDSTIVM